MITKKTRRAALIAAAASAVSLAMNGVALAEDAAPQVEATPPIPGQVSDLPADDPTTVDAVQKHFVAEPVPGTGQEAARASSSTALAASLSDCPSGWDCMWTGGYFTGPMGKLAGQNADWSAFSQSACTTSGTFGATWKDCASSAYARTSNGFELRRDVNFDGGGLILHPGDSVQDFDPWYIDNNVASNYR